jgi:O-antigen/teichoic acid export membrane protein
MIPRASRAARASTLRGVQRTMRRLREAIGGDLRRAVAIVAGGHVVAYAVAAVSYPILSRLYEPSQFGAFAAAAALLVAMLTIICLTFDRAVPLPEHDKIAGDLIVVCVLATIVLTALTTLALVVAGPQILGLFNAEALAPYWWLFAAALAAGGLYVALTGWAVRQGDFKGIATARMGQSVATAATQVAAGIAGASSAGLLAGDALGRTAGGARLSTRAWRGLGRALSRTTRARVRWAARRYRRFPLLASWPTLINAVSQDAPLLLLITFYGAHTGGLFALAQRLIGAPVTLVVLSVGQVFFAEAARQAREGGRLTPMFRTALGKLAVACVPFMILAPLLAVLLVGPVFGSEWSTSGTYIAIMTPLYATQVLSAPFAILEVLERQDLMVVREVLRIALLTLAILVAQVLALPALWAVVLLSTAGTCAYLIHGGIAWYALTTYDKSRNRLGAAEPRAERLAGETASAGVEPSKGRGQM